MHTARLHPTCRLALLGLLCSTPFARGQSIVIGYTNCTAVTNYSQPLMDRIGQLKWYFTHASVGGNMLSGIAALHATNAAFYQLHGIAATNVPPAQTEAGAIYEYDRDNPPWRDKFSLFRSCISNGWRYPTVNIAVNKLCFIDSDASLSETFSYLSQLESAYPETIVVCMTMPLTTGTDISNYNRNAYNSGLREWCSTNNRVLFDIADIESHNRAGEPVTFSSGGVDCQQLYTGYAADEGHLNSEGSELVAKGFYALAAALLARDCDGDGVSDGDELIAGTYHRDPHSLLKLLTPVVLNEGSLVVSWSSVSNRFYSLERRSSPAMSEPATEVLVDDAATPPVNTFTDAPPTSGPWFYRLRVRQ